MKTCSSLEEQGIKEGAYLTAVARVPHVAATKKAFALWFEQGEVVAWGDPHGLLPRAPQVELLAATDYAFAAVAAGRVLAWGHAGWGGTAPKEVVEDATTLLGNSMAFCLLRRSGEPICWGRSVSGGRAKALGGPVTALGATSFAFAAATERHVHSWGLKEYGGGEVLEIEQVYEPLL